MLKFLVVFYDPAHGGRSGAKAAQGPFYIPARHGTILTFLRTCKWLEFFQQPGVYQSATFTIRTFLVSCLTWSIRLFRRAVHW